MGINTPSASAIIIAIAIAIIIIIAVACARERESLANPSKIRSAVERGGADIFSFRKAIGDPKFDPYVFAQLVSLKKSGNLTEAEIARLTSRHQ